MMTRQGYPAWLLDNLPQAAQVERDLSDAARALTLPIGTRGASSWYIASSLFSRALFIVYDHGWRVEWPVNVRGQGTFYDWPEAIPNAAKRAAERAYHLLGPCTYSHH
jgi:hypothetical protein